MKVCAGRGKPQREQTAWAGGGSKGFGEQESWRCAPGQAKVRWQTVQRGGARRAKGPQAEGTAHVCAVVGGFLELKERSQRWSSGAVRTGGVGGGRGWADSRGRPSHACVKSLASLGAVGAHRGAAGRGKWPLC